MSSPRFTPGPALAGARPLAIAAAVVLVITALATFIQPPVPPVTESATSIQPMRDFSFTASARPWRKSFAAV